jgi:hypothetical protein
MMFLDFDARFLTSLNILLEINILIILIIKDFGLLIQYFKSYVIVKFIIEVNL